MKIGVLLESFKKPFRESVKIAASLGIKGVQIYAKGDTIYDGMSKSQIKEVKVILEDDGLEVSALCGDFGCRMFYYPDEMRVEIEREKRVVELAKELGTNIVTTHIGVVPELFEGREFDTMHSVCASLATHAASLDAYFAVETGPETASTLKRFLDTLPSRGLGVNLDPANLVMVTGDDPVAAVDTLKDYIVHTHAKDGVRLKPSDPRRLYLQNVVHVDPQDFSEFMTEVPLGQGEVPWDKYYNALKNIGYDGYLTIEREVGGTPQADIELAQKFLQEVMRNNP